MSEAHNAAWRAGRNEVVGGQNSTFGDEIQS